MSWWRVRDPGSFPLEFHWAMQAGLGVHKVVRPYGTRLAAEAAQKDFSVFRYSMRHYTQHATAYFEARFSHRTKVKWNGDRQHWELLLTSREKVEEDIEWMR